jgi:hypothetical protein
MIQNFPYEICALICAVASQDKSEANNSPLWATDNRKVLQDGGAGFSTVLAGNPLVLVYRQSVG